MIRQLLQASLLSCLAINTFASNQQAQSHVLSPEQLHREVQFSQSISQQLAKQLEQRLMAAVKSGGLSSGIEQCKIAAPEVSQQLKGSHSNKLISAGRVSLKSRNPKNQADDWQAAKLQKYDELNAKGQQAGFQYRLFTQGGKRELNSLAPFQLRDCV